MTRSQTFVIVGGGLAGAKAAETLRTEGFDGKVIIVGAEHHRPYARPPLSKDVLRGESPVDKAYVHEEGFYEENRIELQPDTIAVAVAPTSHLIYLKRGEELEYDKLLIATGSVNRRLDVPGGDLDGIHYLRSIEEMQALHEGLSTTGKVAVVGAGWIGSEVAASARQMGNEVTVIDPGDVPLGRVLGPEVGTVYKKIHEENGVKFIFGVGVAGFEGDGRVTGVRLGDDRVIEADLVVVGIGAVPRVELAREARMEVDNGIVADEHLHTPTEDIWVAGDVAAAFHPRYGKRIRVEHWSNAIHQGETAAKNMLGGNVVYDRLPYFYSDQYDLGMEYSGLAEKWDEVVFRGDVDGREFLAFWLDGGKVVAAMNANIWDVTDDLRALVEADKVVDTAKLTDPSVAIHDLL